MEILNFKNATDINFQDIIVNKQTCDMIIGDANAIIKTIKDQYAELLKNICNVSSYLGIDSFNFQNKLLDIHLDYLKKIYNIIINRLYCDYYKIYKSIKKYVETNCTSIPIIEELFIVYKDLDMEKIYSFQDVIRLKNSIHQYIKNMADIVINKSVNIKKFVDSNTRGYNVNYYINEENADICINTNKIHLFIGYLDSCNTYHNKYLTNLINQLRYFITNIKRDISDNNYDDPIFHVPIVPVIAPVLALVAEPIAISLVVEPDVVVAEPDVVVAEPISLIIESDVVVIEPISLIIEEKEPVAEEEEPVAEEKEKEKECEIVVEKSSNDTKKKKKKKKKKK